MRVLALVLVSLLFIGGVMAEDTGRGVYDVNVWPGINDDIEDYLNTTDLVSHKHQYEQFDRDNAVGLGVDLVVWKNDKPEQLLDEVVIEEKYDLENDENSIYAVARVNLFQFWQK